MQLEKTRMMPMPVSKKLHNIGNGQTYGRTDGGSEIVKQYRALYAMHRPILTRAVEMGFKNLGF